MSGDGSKSEAFWSDAIKAAHVMALDPHAIGGIWVQCCRGGAVEQWLSYLQDCIGPDVPYVRMPLNADDGRLLGGLDLASTLGTGTPVVDRGLIAEANGGIALVPNVECVRPGTVSALASALDNGALAVEREGISAKIATRFGVVALDEGGEPVAPALRERLALQLDFTTVRAQSAMPVRADRAALERAQRALSSIDVPAEAIEAICSACLALGIGSMRAGTFAIKVARASAALAGRERIEDGDLAFAVRVVLASRATQVPSDLQEPEEAPPPPEPPENESADTPDSSQQDPQNLDELLIAAAAAALPQNILDALRAGPQANRRKGAFGRSGAKQKSPSHGRRLGARRGDPRRGSPLDIIETLRAAAPWQTLRRQEAQKFRITQVQAGTQAGTMQGMHIRAMDFRVRLFKNKRETSTIFVVDASGSAALHRLAEAKGAIELLLADCYSRRDHVALVSFRGKSANMLLSPTRSLARVKRQVTALPGGGGTPLASAADCAAALADAEHRKGRTPSVVFLTDGKANIDRKGVASREGAMADALSAARMMRLSKCPAIVIDTSPRPSLQSGQFAAEMGAKYVPLPYAGARALSDAVKQIK